MELKEKIVQHFEGKVVRKDLTALVKGNNPVPAYVLEYLLGQYCAIDDEEVIKSGGKVMTIPLVKGISTTKIIKKMI